jgi:hypothetical protein
VRPPWIRPCYVMVHYLHRRVRQGNVLSTKLYLVFVNDLINELEDSKQGALLHDLNASSPVQADDISIVTTNRQSSQIMVDICELYSIINCSFRFSATKGKLLQCGKTDNRTRYTVI